MENMEKVKKKIIKIIVITSFLVIKPNKIFSQDFYINKNLDVIYLNYDISPQWINLNLNESYEFLESSRFKDIQTNSNDNIVKVYGTIINEDYTYMRTLVFENKLIKEYNDIVTFDYPCLLCTANDIKLLLKDNPSMNEITEKEHKRQLSDDIKLKDIFYRCHKQSIEKDGIKTELLGDITDYSFEFYNSVDKYDFNIYRNCKLVLNEKYNPYKFYTFYSARRIVKNEKKYLVGNYNLNEVNQYDLNLMIDIFLLDCKNHKIPVKKGKVITSFETLDRKTLGLSYGIYNDLKIDLKIDPSKWESSSIPKRWYLIYHELGHDVLNLEHGNGGKMMFNFADKGYSWEEFWVDRNYMFTSYKRK